ncbi:hypothetical protein BGZ65_008510, partial [Modicella reniformis]
MTLYPALDSNFLTRCANLGSTNNKRTYSKDLIEPIVDAIYSSGTMMVKQYWHEYFPQSSQYKNRKLRPDHYATTMDNYP